MEATKDKNIFGRTKSANKLLTNSVEKTTPKKVC